MNNERFSPGRKVWLTLLNNYDREFEILTVQRIYWQDGFFHSRRDPLFYLRDTVTGKVLSYTEREIRERESLNSLIQYG